MPEPRVKICGVTRRRDALAADRAGADFVGHVLVHGSGREVDPDLAARLSRDLAATSVAVLADAGTRGAVDRARRSGAGVVQLHGGEAPEEVREIADAGPWSVWKAIRVRRPDEVLAALDRYGPVVDGVVLDGWHPHVLGGTGRRFSWREIAAVRSEFPEGLTLVVAGGLTPGNVREALAALSPDVVDVSSGVESAPGVKDPALVRSFVEAVRASAAGSVP